MKKLLLLAVGAAVILSSCSKDKEIGTTPDNGGEISFRSFIDKGAGSRAAITNTDNILSFTVTGWWDENDPGSNGLADLGQVMSDKYLFNGYDISRRESSYADWDYSPKRYWPEKGKVYFFAYSPAASINVGTGITDYVSPSAFLPSPGGTYLSYTVPDPAEDTAQEDFLLANTGALYDETVKLNFAHALSRVKFFARTTNDDVNYTIHSVELLDLWKSAEINLEKIPTTGVFTYPIAATDTWANHATLSNNTKEDVALDMGTAALLLSKDFESLTGDISGLMVMPQETAPGDPDDPASGGFLLKINYSAYHNGIFYEENTTRYFAVEDPASAGNPLTFEMGRQYNFMLTFGDEVGDAILFEVEIPRDWNNMVPPIPVRNYATRANFPDPDLLAYLLSPTTMFDENGDGMLSYDEIVKITAIEVPVNTISLVGIELLPKLTSITFAAGYSGTAFPAMPTQQTTVTDISLENAALVTTLAGIENFTRLNSVTVYPVTVGGTIGYPTMPKPMASTYVTFKGTNTASTGYNGTYPNSMGQLVNVENIILEGGNGGDLSLSEFRSLAINDMMENNSGAYKLKTLTLITSDDYRPNMLKRQNMAASLTVVIGWTGGTGRTITLHDSFAAGDINFIRPGDDPDPTKLLNIQVAAGVDLTVTNSGFTVVNP